MISVPDFFTFANLLDTLFVGLAILLLLVVAFTDAKNRHISNKLVAAIAILGIARLLVIGNPITTIYTVAVAIIVLFVTFLLFMRKIIGGGDAKLLIAIALLIGYQSMFPFLVIMSLCGLLLSLVVLMMIWHAKVRMSVPYGVAIAAGAIVTLSLQHSFIG